MTKEDSRDVLKPLFDTPIYTRSFRPPGYKKYTIVAIRNLPKNDENTVVNVIMKKNGNRKGTLFTQFFACELEDKKYKLYSTKPLWSTNLTDFFIMMEANQMMAFRNIKMQKQYKYELGCNKNKYPEYWL